MNTNFYHDACDAKNRSTCIICSQIDWDKVNEAEKELEAGRGIRYEVRNGRLRKVKSDKGTRSRKSRKDDS